MIFFQKSFFFKGLRYFSSQKKLSEEIDMLRNHIRDVHKNPENHYCEICRATFTSLRAKKKHEECHEENRKMFSCDVCGKAFTRKPNFEGHKLSHNINNKKR